ncbi:MAG: hypothetical protein L0H73_10410 [Nitrococcus sp.]|nr:hypothetical protein [Nitrococcus sp.]
MGASANEALRRQRQAADPLIGRAAFVWSLGSLCQIHRMPFDSRLLLGQFPPPYTFASLQQSGEALGFDIEPQALARAVIAGQYLPALALLEDEKTPEEGAPYVRLADSAITSRPRSGRAFAAATPSSSFWFFLTVAVSMAWIAIQEIIRQLRQS